MKSSTRSSARFLDSRGIPHTTAPHPQHADPWLRWCSQDTEDHNHMSHFIILTLWLFSEEMERTHHVYSNVGYIINYSHPESDRRMLHQNILSSDIKQGSNTRMYQATFTLCIWDRVDNKRLKLGCFYTKDISLLATDRLKRGGHLFMGWVMSAVSLLHIMKR